MKSKFRRVFSFLGGDFKIPTEEFIDFLDSTIDEAIPIMHRPGVTNYFHAHENGFSYGGKWIFIREKMDFHAEEMDFHAEETLVSPDGTYIFSP